MGYCVYFTHFFFIALAYLNGGYTQEIGACDQRPFIIETETVLNRSYLFDANNIFHDDCERGQNLRYWLAADKEAGKGIIIDSGCTQTFTKFTLGNIIRRADFNRATKRFTLELSYDLSHWTKLTSTSFVDTKGKSCNMAKKEISVSRIMGAFRYIRFRIDSYYGLGGGLQFLGWETECEKEDYPRIVYEKTISQLYPAKNVLKDSENPLSNSTCWLPPKRSYGYFIIDTGYSKRFTAFHIRNTFNGILRNRCTLKFRISLSANYKYWYTAVVGTLQNSQNRDYIPVETFLNERVAAASRYIKFKIDLFSGEGGGLEYFSWEEDSCQTPTNFLPPTYETPYNKLENMLYDTCYDYYYHNEYYHAYYSQSWRGNVENSSFILDLHCSQKLSKIIFKNYADPWRKHNYTIQVSNDKIIWTNISTGVLVRGDYYNYFRPYSCEIEPNEIVLPGNSFKFRYMKMTLSGMYGGLDFFNWFKSNCQKDPKIYSKDQKIWNNSLEKLFINECEDQSNDSSLHLPDGAVNKGFTIDLGCRQKLEGITVMNTINKKHGIKGTRGFSVEFSSNNQTWNLGISGEMEVSVNESCSTNKEEFPLQQEVGQARFIRFTVKSYYGVGGGLQYFDWKLAECQENPKIVQESKMFLHSNFNASNVLVEDSCEAENTSLYWALKDGVVNEGFVIDTGCNHKFESIFLLNSHGGDGNNRGTRKFSLEFSKDNHYFVKGIGGELLDARGTSCDIPLQEFPLKKLFGVYRYIRFTSLSYYGKSPALNYLAWRLALCQKPPAVYTSSSFLKSYMAENILFDDCKEYMLMHPRYKNGYIRIDIGCQQRITSISIKNTSGPENDRGAKSITISFSKHYYDQVFVLTTELEDPRGKSCDEINTEVFSTEELSSDFRYIIIDIHSYYGKGGGLQYISWTTGQLIENFELLI